MKLRITGFEEQKVTSNVEKENPTIDEKISSKIPDEEKSDFEYDNSGIYFRNGTDIMYDIKNDDICLSFIKFPNNKIIRFECDDLGNLISIDVPEEE